MNTALTDYMPGPLANEKKNDSYYHERTVKDKFSKFELFAPHSENIFLSITFPTLLLRVGLFVRAQIELT